MMSLASCMIAAVVNPLLTLFPRELVFLQTFDDDSMLPQVGVPAASWREPAAEFADGGVLGRCLSAGSSWFTADAFGAPMLDTTGSGTMVCWVRYVDAVAPGAVPPIFFFSAHLAQSPKPGKLLCFKQGNDPDMVAMHESYTADRRVAAGARAESSYGKWLRGEWRMVAMSLIERFLGTKLVKHSLELAHVQPALLGPLIVLLELRCGNELQGHGAPIRRARRTWLPQNRRWPRSMMCRMVLSPPRDVVPPAR